MTADPGRGRWASPPDVKHFVVIRLTETVFWAQQAGRSEAFREHILWSDVSDRDRHLVTVGARFTRTAGRFDFVAGSRAWVVVLHDFQPPKAAA